jgi:aryl carrier-like protein
VFRDLLDRADLGVFDDFFDLGGNSVAAAQLMSRLRAASGFDLPLRNLFERPTVAGLAEAIDGLAWVAKSKAPTSGAGRREEIEL